MLWALTIKSLLTIKLKLISQPNDPAIIRQPHHSVDLLITHTSLGALMGFCAVGSLDELIVTYEN